MVVNSPSRFVCRCGKSFLRKEHLRRHEATHAAPSFVCGVCQRAFTRNDLLRRHILLHDNSAVPDARRSRACDACHDNKTRCDGSSNTGSSPESGDGRPLPCSLCAKRGLQCTFNRSANADGSQAGSTTADGSQNRKTRSVAKLSSECWLHETIEASRENPSSREDEAWTWTARDGQAARIAIRHVVTALRKHFENLSGQTHAAAPEVKEWLKAGIESYFTKFHDNWPVIHAVTFDERSDSVATVGTVAMIGNWYRHPKDEKAGLVELHKLMVFHFFKSMADPAFQIHAKEKPWPIDMYHAMLLHVIFAFETGQDALVSKARLLLGLLVSTLREQGIFDIGKVQEHQNTHFPGTWKPWVFGLLEKVKRLVGYTLRIDTYIAILRKQPTCTLCEEMNMPLQSSFSTYNAYGLDVYFSRSVDNVADRETYSIADLCDTSPRHLDSGFLIEDIQLGFCGIWPQIWNMTHRRSPDHPLLPDQLASCQELVWRRLCFWRSRLDDLTNAINEPDLHPLAVETLLRHYAGRERPHQPSYRERVTRRVCYRLFDSCMLHRLLSLYIPVQTLEKQGTAAMGTFDMQEAFFQALSTLRAYEAFATSFQAPSACFSGIAHVALMHAAEVAWIILTSPAQPCRCLDGQLQPQPIEPHLPPSGTALSLVTIADEELSSVIDSWVRTGESVLLDGEPICGCRADAWVGRFLRALEAGTQFWEAGSEYAKGLRNRMESLLMASLGEATM